MDPAYLFGTGRSRLSIELSILRSKHLLLLSQFRRYTLKRKLKVSVSFNSEKSNGRRCFCACLRRKWSIRAIALVTASLACIIRWVHMLDPEGQANLYSNNEFVVELLLRFPQLCVIVGIVLVMLLWRRLLRSRQKLKKLNNKLAPTTKAALYVMAALFLIASVSVVIDFGEKGNNIAAWLTWSSAVSFLFVLMVIVFHYTGQVVQTLTAALRPPSTTKILQKAMLTPDDDALCFSSSGLCYCCPSSSSSKLASPKKVAVPPPVQLPAVRTRRVSLSRITQASNVMSRSNVQRVRSAVLWTALLWSIGLCALAPAFIADSIVILSRSEGALTFDYDGAAFVVYFAAFRFAEVLALAGILRAQWLGVPEDIDFCCFRTSNHPQQPSEKPGQILLGLFLQLNPFLIWIALVLGKATLPDQGNSHRRRRSSTTPVGRGNSNRPKLSSSLSAQRMALARAVARSSSISSATKDDAASSRKSSIEEHDSKFVSPNRSPAATYVNSLQLTQLLRRQSSQQARGASVLAGHSRGGSPDFMGVTK